MLYRERVCVYIEASMCVALQIPFLVHTQGLFHPARKVRQVHWKIYNMLYIGSQVCVFVLVLVLVCVCLCVCV